MKVAFDSGERTDLTDANVLVMRLRLTSPTVAKEMLDSWFSAAIDPSEKDNIARLERG